MSMNKVLAVFLVTVIGANALSLEDVDFVSLIQSGTSANDAVQAVYQLLQDLKQANLEAQHIDDKKNITDEEIGLKVITELTKVVDMNRRSFSEAKAHRDWVDSEIRDTIDFINWAHARIAELEKRSIDLQEMRCFSNGLFVRSIKQHKDALEVIRLLKQDLSGYLTGGASLSEIKIENVADKIKMYSSLFNEKAMEEFTQLASDQASGGAELHAQRDDFVATGSQGGAGGKGDTLGQQVYNLLCQLEEQLKASLASLEANEIAAAYHLADWLSDAESEKLNLIQEIEKKTNYQDKLQLAQKAALASQAKVNAVLKDSQVAVDQAVSDLQEKRDHWLAEFNRRNGWKFKYQHLLEENAIIDEVIYIFKQQVMNMAGGTSYGKK